MSWPVQFIIWLLILLLLSMTSSGTTWLDEFGFSNYIQIWRLRRFSNGKFINGVHQGLLSASKLFSGWTEFVQSMFEIKKIIYFYFYLIFHEIKKIFRFNFQVSLMCRFGNSVLVKTICDAVKSPFICEEPEQRRGNPQKITGQIMK